MKRVVRKWHLVHSMNARCQSTMATQSGSDVSCCMLFLKISLFGGVLFWLIWYIEIIIMTIFISYLVSTRESRISPRVSYQPEGRRADAIVEG